MTVAAALLLAILIWASNSVMVTPVVVVCGLVIAAGVYLLNRI